MHREIGSQNSGQFCTITRILAERVMTYLMTSMVAPLRPAPNILPPKALAVCRPIPVWDRLGVLRISEFRLGLTGARSPALRLERSDTDQIDVGTHV